MKALKAFLSITRTVKDNSRYSHEIFYVTWVYIWKTFNGMSAAAKDFDYIFLKLNCKCDVTTQGSFAKKKITLVIIQFLITLKAIVQPNTPTSNSANKKLRTLCHVLNLSYFFIFCNKKIDFQSIHMIWNNRVHIINRVGRYIYLGTGTVQS